MLPHRLPIDAALPELQRALAEHLNVVLHAPPGAGKSTGVPLALLGESWRGHRKIVMLEPRRLAARAVATRMAQTLDEPVGRTVGYRTRLESKTSAATRIEVVTEGILTRWLQHDAALEDVALVIFDEFHERSLHADLGLALCLDAQSNLREDLRVLVMSATLDGAAVARLLGDAPVVAATGRAFDVQTHYRQRIPGQASRIAGQDEDIARLSATTILRALDQEAGDILVFLPGQGEIRRTQRLLEDANLPREVRVLPLFGDLAIEQQDAALKPAAAGMRKVVLATNIAETSLTIEGIRIVVDSGLERRARFDPASAMSRLETMRISRASADQRRGRAGRLAAGVCYRLWTETEHASLSAHTPPEILEADLTSLALELANWGIADPHALRWLDPPPSAAYSQARDLLHSLQALVAGRISEHGRVLAQLGTHPRLAHMLARGAELGLAELALRIAAILGERDILRPAGPRREVDLHLRLDALRGERNLPSGMSVDQAARQRALRSMEQLQLRLKLRPADLPRADDTHAGRLLALAYPDRIAQSRESGGRYLLASGRGAQLPDAQSIAGCEFIVIADLDAGSREATIRLAVPIERATLEIEFADRIEVRERIEWNSREQIVDARRERWLGALRLDERRIEAADPSSVLAAMLTGLRELGPAALPWTKEARALQTRMMFAHISDVQGSWPDASDAALFATLERWLAPWLDGVTRRDHLARLDMHEILSGLLNWDAQQRLNTVAPTHLTVPSGSRIPIDYSGESPTVSVRLQEMFGMHETPTVASGRVPVTLELLSPAHRPVQVTRDLVSFWNRGYPEVKKELKGRYPKHYWPDDPWTAEATARRKPR